MPTTKLVYSVVRDNTDLGDEAMCQKVAMEMSIDLPMVQTKAEMGDRDEEYDRLHIIHTITRNTQEEANEVARQILNDSFEDIEIYQAEDAMGNVQFSEETDEDE